MVVKRLYQTTLGRLELEIDPTLDVVSAYLFDAEGRVARSDGDEWPWADVEDLLAKDIGLPTREAKTIAASFVETARTEGHEQIEPSGNIGGFLVVGAILALLGIGIWTTVTWIF